MGKNKNETSGEKLPGLLKLTQILSLILVFFGGIIIGFSSSIFFPSPSDFLFLSSASSSSSRSLCVDQKPDFLQFQNFTHPATRSHQMTDEELFWRASLQPNRSTYPFHRVPKLAFMFLTRGPLPFLPLWEQFFAHNDNLFTIYLHGPRGFTLNISESSVFFRKEIPSKDVQWGDISLVDAERRLLANALLDFSNERFILLSESCVPVFNFKTVYNYLTSSSTSFVESYDDPSRNGRGRYSRRMYPDINLRQWRKGSQWFELQREVAVYIISDDKYYDLFRRYCKPACYPDEHYIPTFLNMFHGEKNSNRTVTWVDWSILGPHPATYEAPNITMDFILSIRQNATDCLYNEETTSLCYLFARKFAPNSLGPLLNLSAVLFKF